ncbi:hypothetical protein LINGRAHAP2_LOCUS13800, partial [Linum grandiflorum]
MKLIFPKAQVKPPSITRLCPVTNPASSSLARNTAPFATSSILPPLPFTRLPVSPTIFSTS